MTADELATIIVPANVAPALRKLGEILGPDTDGMFTAALSVTGAVPATHFISSGLVYPHFCAAIRNGDQLYDLVQERRAQNGKPMPYTKTQVKAALAQIDVSQDEPFAAMQRLGLQLIAGDLL